jgi:hypothetical protein
VVVGFEVENFLVENFLVGNFLASILASILVQWFPDWDERKVVLVHCGVLVPHWGTTTSLEVFDPVVCRAMCFWVAFLLGWVVCLWVDW